MAFSSKLGSLFRQNGQTPMISSMLNSLRCMSTSTKKLFIGGLSYGTDDQSLREAFSGFGDVTEARVIADRDTGRSRGFGFVNFADDESASNALSAMDGQVRKTNNYLYAEHVSFELQIDRFVLKISGTPREKYSSKLCQ
uniref:RRM domain-containing protein n=1 Tax=Gossypium raimondii TaxID=29730 RepID=A0A0D2N785_GOSRA|nr:hypothetical protein B456_005G028100 [Gossypium raimondii]